MRNVREAFVFIALSLRLGSKESETAPKSFSHASLVCCVSFSLEINLSKILKRIYRRFKSILVRTNTDNTHHSL
jgi:hypothetical protein